MKRTWLVWAHKKEGFILEAWRNNELGFRDGGQFQECPGGIERIKNQVNFNFKSIGTSALEVPPYANLTESAI